MSLTVADAPDSVRAWLIGADMARSLSAIGVCVVVAWLCLRLFVGKPFVRSMTWGGIGIVAILVILSSMGAPLLDGIANAQAAIALDLVELHPFVVVFDPAPIGGVRARRRGRRVRDRATLQRDSEGGLV